MGAWNKTKLTLQAAKVAWAIEDTKNSIQYRKEDLVSLAAKCGREAIGSSISFEKEDLRSLCEEGASLKKRLNDTQRDRELIEAQREDARRLVGALEQKKSELSSKSSGTTEQVPEEESASLTAEISRHRDNIQNYEKRIGDLTESADSDRKAIDKLESSLGAKIFAGQQPVPSLQKLFDERAQILEEIRSLEQKHEDLQTRQDELKALTGYDVSKAALATRNGFYVVLSLAICAGLCVGGWKLIFGSSHSHKDAGVVVRSESTSQPTSDQENWFKVGGWTVAGGIEDNFTSQVDTMNFSKDSVSGVDVEEVMSAEDKKQLVRRFDARCTLTSQTKNAFGTYKKDELQFIYIYDTNTEKARVDDIRTQDLGFE